MSRPLRAGQGSRAMGRRNFLGRQTVFHQPDMYAAASDRLGFIITLAARVAERHCVHTVDGNVVLCYQIALDRLGQPLRTLNAVAARQG